MTEPLIFIGILHENEHKINMMCSSQFNLKGNSLMFKNLFYIYLHKLNQKFKSGSLQNIECVF